MHNRKQIKVMYYHYKDYELETRSTFHYFNIQHVSELVLTFDLIYPVPLERPY